MLLLCAATFVLGMAAQPPRPFGWDESRMALACIAAGSALGVLALVVSG